MTILNKLRQIANLPTDYETWEAYARKNKPLDWINVNIAKTFAKEIIEMLEPNEDEPLTRERLCLIQLRDHFNSKNTYPPEEKIEVAKMIINDGLSKPKPIEDKRQIKLEM